MSKCCVCGSTTNELRICHSTVCNEQKTYCIGCLKSGLEPYEDLVNYGSEYDTFSQSFIEKILNQTLRFNGKSIEQFNEDVRLRLEEAENGSS